MIETISLIILVNLACIGIVYGTIRLMAWLDKRNDDLEVIGNIHDKAGDDLSNYVPVEFDPMLGQSESED